MRKSILAGPGYHLGNRGEDEQRKNDALMLLFLFADDAEELGLDAQALELAQRQLSERQVVVSPRRRRALPPRRHLRS